MSYTETCYLHWISGVELGKAISDLPKVIKPQTTGNSWSISGLFCEWEWPSISFAIFMIFCSPYQFDTLIMLQWIFNTYVLLVV